MDAAGEGADNDWVDEPPTPLAGAAHHLPPNMVLLHLPTSGAGGAGGGLGGLQGGRGATRCEPAGLGSTARAHDPLTVLSRLQALPLGSRPRR